MQKVALVVGLLLACAAGGLAQDAPREIGEAEWRAIVDRALEDKALTTIQRVEALSAALRDVVVRRRGKVRDVRPSTWRGEDTVTVEVIGVHDGRRMRDFVLRPEDAAVGRTWGRWDRIEWRERPSGTPDGQPALDPIYESIADLVRTENPGIEPAPASRPEDRQLVRWLRRAFTEILAGDTAGAWRAMEHAQKHVFLVPAVVRDVVDDRVRVDLTESSEIQDAASRRTFGFHGRDVFVVVEDPQAREACAVDQAVLLWVTPRFAETAREFAASDYAVRFEVGFARLGD